ncbi:MAG TPA: hypothetical protein VGI58_15765 [Streptosporangiaceae bacterium]
MSAVPANPLSAREAGAAPERALDRPAVAAAVLQQAAPGRIGTVLEPAAPGAADVRTRAVRSSPRRTDGNLHWPLLAVLAVQGALSLRLTWSNTAFQDEALYLRAGHLEWAHWLHGVVIPDFPSYFSGAPVLYPPVGALADSVGGLAAARILSLSLMLAVTSLLAATTSRLYGRRAAILAAALFATLTGTQFLGALATFDSTALFLLALAAWLGIRAAECAPARRTVLLACAGVALAGANGAAYSTVLLTPVVVAVVAAATWRQHGLRATLAAGGAVLCCWTAVIGAAVVVGGRQYWRGVMASTVDRPAADTSVRLVLQHAYIWTSLVLVLALLGAVLAALTKMRARLLPLLLTAAAVAVPAAQANLHTTVSLQKHVVFGAWFAAIAAGYALARLSRVDPGRGWAPVMALPIAASTLFGSVGQAGALFQVWPNSAAVIQALRAAVASHPGSYLAEDYDVEAYYLRSEAAWQRWNSTYYFRHPDAAPGIASYRAAISSHVFALVILDFGDTQATDRHIVADMALAGGYHVLARVGHFTIWATDTSARRSGASRARS